MPLTASANVDCDLIDHSGRATLRGWFVLFWALVMLRFLLSANVLNLFFNYSTDGGLILSKIHPGTYGTIVVFLATILTTRIQLGRWELRALRALIWFVTAMAMIAIFALLLGHLGSMGYLIDSYFVACVAAALMLFFPTDWRQRLGSSLLIFNTASAAVGLLEFATHMRLLPYPFQELSFRPTGLTEHPLMFGLFNAVGISFVAASQWRGGAKAAAITIMLFGALVSGARVASIVAAISVLVVIALQDWTPVSPQTQLRLKAIILLCLLLVVPVALFVLPSVGLLDRFQSGLFDESAMARVNVYRLFGFVSWEEILFGTDIDAIRRLALSRLDLDYIESPVVMFVFQFGLFGTIAFVLCLIRTFVALLAGAGRYVVVGTVAFFVVALGNNSLATKVPNIMLMIMLLIVAFHGERRPTRTASGRCKGPAPAR
jgi:hypothetical protein